MPPVFPQKEKTDMEQAQPRPEESKKKSAFLEIINSWPEYFENMDEGLGTSYERFILHKYFRKIKDEFAVGSVLEAPSFGMTGVSNINSLWWAGRGITPLIFDNDKQRIRQSQKVWSSIPLSADIRYVGDFDKLPVDDNAVDLSWNFAALWFVRDLRSFFSELNRVTLRVIFICVPNNYGIGFKLRALLNSMDIPGFFPQNIKPRVILKEAAEQKWNLRERGYLDIPPWPDIAMKKEVLFSKLGLSFLLKKEESQAQSRTCIVDFFNGQNPDLEREILKYDYLEKAPSPIKQVWGHHRYFIFSKD